MQFLGETEHVATVIPHVMHGMTAALIYKISVVSIMHA